MNVYISGRQHIHRAIMVLGRRQPPTTSQDLPHNIPNYVNSFELFICFKYNNDFYSPWILVNSNCALLWPILWHGIYVQASASTPDRHNVGSDPSRSALG